MVGVFLRRACVGADALDRRALRRARTSASNRSLGCSASLLQMECRIVFRGRVVARAGLVTLMYVGVELLDGRKLDRAGGRRERSRLALGFDVLRPGVLLAIIQIALESKSRRNPPDHAREAGRRGRTFTSKL